MRSIHPDHENATTDRINDSGASQDFDGLTNSREIARAILWLNKSLQEHAEASKAIKATLKKLTARLVAVDAEGPEDRPLFRDTIDFSGHDGEAA